MKIWVVWKVEKKERESSLLGPEAFCLSRVVGEEATKRLNEKYKTPSSYFQLGTPFEITTSKMLRDL